MAGKHALMVESAFGGRLDMASKTPGLPLRIALPFSAPSIPLTVLGVVIAVYLPNFFAGQLGVSMAMIGVVLMGVRLVDMPVDVILAALMDHTRSRFGRYRLWLVAGAPVLMAALYALFMAPPRFSAAYLFGWYFTLALGASICGLAHQAWTASLAPRYDDRSRLFGLINAVGVAGVLVAMSVLILGPSLGLRAGDSVRASGWFTILATPVCMLLAAAVAPETIAPNIERRPSFADYREVLLKPDLLRLFLAQLCLSLGPTWMSAIYLFFFEDSRGFSSQQSSILLAVYILAGIPGALLTAVVAQKFGKHRTLIGATTAYSLGLLSVFVVTHGNMVVGLPVMLFEGMMAAGFGMMVQAMLADVGDEIRLTQGRQRMSLVYSVNTLATKIAAAAAIGLTFPLLEALGFNPREGAVNTAAAIHNLDIAFIAGPILFVMLGGACVIGWRLDAARHGLIRAELDSRDAALEALQAEPSVGPASLVIAAAAEPAGR
jgi:Na+/melibiose symporter-like transporter